MTYIAQEVYSSIPTFQTHVTCKFFKDCLIFIKTKIFSHCKCFGYA